LESDHCNPEEKKTRKHQEREREIGDVACTALGRKGTVIHY
jgi:hypothetical protein